MGRHFSDHRDHRRIFGFTGIAEASATIAQVLFGIFLFLFIGAIAIGLVHRLKNHLAAA